MKEIYSYYHIFKANTNCFSKTNYFQFSDAGIKKNSVTL